MSLLVTVRAAGANAIEKDFLRMSKESSASVDKLVRHHGQLLKTRVQANASGRPGPNAPTGDYRRSISLAVVKTADTTAAYVGTNLPQGRRLEFGFHGADSLGRVYNQQPLPHFGPAMDQISPEYLTAIEALLRKL